MSILEILLIGLGLSMDAAAVSICKGLATGGVKLRHCLTAGAYFGVFQALMPAIGYALGSTFAHLHVPNSVPRQSLSLFEQSKALETLTGGLIFAKLCQWFQ